MCWRPRQPYVMEAATAIVMEAATAICDGGCCRMYPRREATPWADAACDTGLCSLCARARLSTPCLRCALGLGLDLAQCPTHAVPCLRCSWSHWLRCSCSALQRDRCRALGAATRLALPCESRKVGGRHSLVSHAPRRRRRAVAGSRGGARTRRENSGHLMK